jgi:hypothetical protein
VCQPETYPVKIVSRSEDRAKLVVREWEDAQHDCLNPTTKQWQQSPADLKLEL